MGIWLYKKTDQGAWSVGYYTPWHTWEGVATFKTEEKAAQRVHYLNGGNEFD